MGQTYDYSKIADPADRKEKALSDVQFWLGRQYQPMSEIIQREHKGGMTRKQITMNVSIFLGIEGYPAEIWLDHLGITDQTPKTPSGTAETQANTAKQG